jgi:hypothetical protein
LCKILDFKGLDKKMLKAREQAFLDLEPKVHWRYRKNANRVQKKIDVIRERLRDYKGNLINQILQTINNNVTAHNKRPVKYKIHNTLELLYRYSAKENQYVPAKYFTKIYKCHQNQKAKSERCAWYGWNDIWFDDCNIS